MKHVPVHKLREMPGNPRQITSSELKALVRSIREFGMPQPLVVYAGPEKEHVGEIIGGHQRWKAAKLAGWKTVPVIPWRGPYRKARALNVALNKISGDWDLEKLADFLRDLEDVEVTGFTREEIEALFPQPTAYTRTLAPAENLYVEETAEEVDGEEVRIRRCACCGQPIR